MSRRIRLITVLQALPVAGALLFSATALTGCGGGSGGSSTTGDVGSGDPIEDARTILAGDTSTSLSLKVEGMSCTDCSDAIRSAVVALPGVQSINVSHETGRADVVMSDGAVEAKLAVMRAIQDLGYGVALNS